MCVPCLSTVEEWLLSAYIFLDTMLENSLFCTILKNPKFSGTQEVKASSSSAFPSTHRPKQRPPQTAPCGVPEPHVSHWQRPPPPRLFYTLKENIFSRLVKVYFRRVDLFGIINFHANSFLKSEDYNSKRLNKVVLLLFSLTVCVCLLWMNKGHGCDQNV